MRYAIVLCLALLLSACTSGAGQVTPSANEQNAITALQKLANGVKVGVNQEQYAQLLVEAKTAFDIAKTVASPAFTQHAPLALQAYTDALNLWREAKYPQLRETSYTMPELMKRYDFTPARIPGNANGEMERSVVFKVIWDEAARQIEEARK